MRCFRDVFRFKGIAARMLRCDHRRSQQLTTADWKRATEIDKKVFYYLNLAKNQGNEIMKLGTELRGEYKPVELQNKII